MNSRACVPSRALPLFRVRYFPKQLQCRSLLKRARPRAFALLTLALVSFPTLALDQPEKKPGFFRQLGTSLKNAGQKMVGAKPRSGTRAHAGPL